LSQSTTKIGVPAHRCCTPQTRQPHAKDDALVNYQYAQQAHEAIKGSQLVLFETAGHFLVPEMERVRQDVREFLQRIC
jgi:pimeloyl-ACP methyl ester carboxylesterase